jgi:hypothetical protein
MVKSMPKVNNKLHILAGLFLIVIPPLSKVSQDLAFFCASFMKVLFAGPLSNEI